MPSTYSNLKIQLMATGENTTTWGNVTNDNLGIAIEEAIVGSADVTFSSGNVTLTLTDTNLSQTARNMRLRLTGTTGGSTRNLVVPSIEKPYIVQNDCADSILVETAAGTGITVPAGKTMWVYVDGVNVVDAVSHLSSLTLGSALPITSGGTGSTSTTYCNLQTNVLGALPVANGGTGTNTAFTAGSVVFAGASGTYSQDNANLFWDDTNNYLGIGTATPTTPIDVFSTGAGAIRALGETTASLFVQLSRSALNPAMVTMRKTRGTVASPTAVASNDQIGLINFSGFGGTTNRNLVQIIGAVETYTSDSDISSVLTFATSPSGSASATERMRITPAGDVGIGTSSPTAKLDISGSLKATSAALATALPVTSGGTGANTASDARTNLGAAASGANSDITSLNPTGGLQVGSPTGGAQGTGTINATGLFINGVAVGTGSGSVTSVNASGGTTGLTFSGGPITSNGTLTLSGTLDLDNGGTGSTTASGARTNLGLGSIATQSASSVSITGGSISGITDLAVADGGTGASTASGARTNLGAAASGANSDITSLSGLTTALSIAQGGTGSNTAGAALTALGALGLTSATFGTNTLTLRITLSNGDTLLIQGGTGSLAANTTGTITFGTSYSTAPVVVVSGGSSDVGAEGGIRNSAAASTTGVAIANAGSVTGTYTWLAIGKD